MSQISISSKALFFFLENISITLPMSIFTSYSHRYSYVSKYAGVLSIYQAVFFELLKGRGLYGPRWKNCYKNCLLPSNHLKLGTTHFWTLTKILTLVTWSKWWRHHYFWWCNYSTTKFFCLTFKSFFCLKSTVSFRKVMT